MVLGPVMEWLLVERAGDSPQAGEQRRMGESPVWATAFGKTHAYVYIVRKGYAAGVKPSFVMMFARFPILCETCLGDNPYVPDLVSQMRTHDRFLESRHSRLHPVG